jgi:hypothetical protein
VEFTGESQIPELSAEEFAAIRATTRPFTLCILKAGPKFEPPGPDPTVGVTAVIFAHGKRNVALHKSGLMPVVCPITDGANITGVSIFDTTLEDAAKIMDADPGVQAGVFTYELHACRSIPGSKLD